MKKMSLFLILVCTLICLEACTGTAPIRNLNGEKPPRGMASIERVTLGAYPQYVLIRSTDTLHHPVLLWLHGGPGASATALQRKYNASLEQHFTVVYWDQRGAGHSYSKDISRSSITVDQYKEDAWQLIQYLKKRFHQEKILLVGHSWGSRLGMYLAKEHPEAITAFVGIGQEVAELQGEALSYAYTYEMAQKTANQKAIDELNESGPPVADYPDLYKNGFWGLVNQKKWLLKLGGERYGKTTYTDWVFDIWFSREYSFADLITWSKASAFTAGAILADPAFHRFDFFQNIPQVQVPVYFVSGKHDYNTPWPLIEKYYHFLQAPHKAFILFEKSGHSPCFEEPEKFNRFMVDTFTAKPEKQLVK